MAQVDHLRVVVAVEAKADLQVVDQVKMAEVLRVVQMVLQTKQTWLVWRQIKRSSIDLG
jgi:hypothetical protein